MAVLSADAFRPGSAGSIQKKEEKGFQKVGKELINRAGGTTYAKLSASGLKLDRAALGVRAGEMVLLEPDVAEAFSDGASVNRALRSYLRASRAKLPDKALQPTSRARRKGQSQRRSRAARG